VNTISRRERLRLRVLRAAPVAGAVVGHVWRSVVHHGQPLGGLVLLSVGAGQVYGPAGWITAGALLLLDRAVDDRREAKAGAR